jgi:transposase
MPRKRKTKVARVQPVLNPHAAGADIGAREIYVALPADATDHSVRRFETFTEDLRKLVAWLQEHGITTLAMEATSVYWIPLAELLEEAGIEVCLVNPRHVKNVPGRKTDVADCQWLQYLHSVGLLRAAFRPAAHVRAVRALWRHRDALVRHSAWHIQHMHKALDQMNLQIHHVIADLSGKSGEAIVEAILAGQRDPAVLAELGDKRLKASKATLRAALTGDYREEHLFCLRQAHEGYAFVVRQIAEVDKQIAGRLAALETAPSPAQAQTDPVTQAGTQAKAKPRASSSHRHQPAYDVRSELLRHLGVDLTSIPGINVTTAQTLWAELGGDLGAFKSGKHFASWLSLCPDNRVSGGKLLSAHTKPSANRAARALRLAAQGLHQAKNELGEFYRRMRGKLGGAAALVATAHKLARIVYAVLTTKQAYRPQLHAQAEQRRLARTLKHLRAKAEKLGFELTPLQQPA